MNYIQQAKTHKNRGSDIIEVNKLTSKIVEDIINEEILDLRIWIENRNSIIYKIKIKDKYLVAKQGKYLNSDEVVKEFTALKELMSINCKELMVPKVLNYSKDHRFYLMDLVEGEPLSSMVNKRNRNKLLRSCKLVGKVLAIIHSEWNCKNYKNTNVACIIEDIKRSPGWVSTRENKYLIKVYDLLKDDIVPTGRIYRDFDPLNTFNYNNRIVLIDPPEKNYKGILYWDLATFFIGLKKALLKKKLYISRKDDIFLNQCKNIVLEEYLNNVTFDIPDLRKFNLTILLLELQRIGELLVFQKKHIKRNKYISVKSLYSRLALKLLNIERKKITAIIKKVK